MSVARLGSVFARCGAARHALVVLVACIGLFAAGCGGPLELTVAGGPDLNSGGNAAVVHIYELSGDSNFRTASISSFWRDQQAALGTEYVGHRQLLLYPDQAESVSIDVQDETSFIGIAADLRQPAEDQWRAIYPLDELRDGDVVVSVGSNTLTVDVQ